jgi:uncharacterized protein (DUF1684 family)
VKLLIHYRAGGRFVSALGEFRKAKDEFFAEDPQSPLTTDQKIKFTGLAYYPENPGLSLELEIEEFPEKALIQMQTSTGDVQEHIRFGKIRFSTEGEQVELTIYQDPHGYFLPFADALAGQETYGAGRYLEPEPSGKGKIRVDFNYAYNPYCAYNDLYSCPLTPWENRLKVAIKAGEKLPDGEWVGHVNYEG